MALLQRPGQTTFDTKFDLTADVQRFLVESLSLWKQDSNFGELQNQAYGYLFPQGTFFLLGESLGIADWVVQRLWTALLLVVAFEGARRLWLVLRPEASPWTAWVAGVAFAVSPRLLGLVGVLSAEVLPTVVLPWAVLPLVMAQQGRIGLRAGALWSGVALLFTGGVNAVENLAVLPLPLFVVLATLGRPGGGRLVRWWLGAVAVASAWWMLPLLVLGRYSPPFLDYIETSAAVVRPLGWTNVARGADHWVSFVFVGGEPWWPGSYELSTDALLIAVTGVVAAAGLWGLTRPHMPLQRPLLWSLLLGMLCLTIARSGPLASPVQEQFQVLLDGPLSMLRNVHKVDPLVRLPLALGLAHLTTAFWPATGRRWAGARTLSQALVVIVLLVSAQPLWTGELRKPGWDAVPQAWGEAASYLAAQEGTGSTLVLPGSGFGQQGWGWTIDEPIQGLASTPWAARSQVPLTPGGTIRNLDAIQERIADGQGSPYLADLLARAGIEYVLVRRDLDLFASGAPDPARVDLAVSRSPGLVPAASFGRSGFGEQPMIDVYRVDREVSRVHAVDLEDVTTLAGGPEDVLTALESGALDPESPVVIAGEEHWPTVSPDVVADGYRKRERSFGRLEDALSEVMARDEPYRLVRGAHDYPGVPATERVYARFDGVASVTASTSGGYADTLGPVRPELGPYAAVDGLPETYWQSSLLTDPEGQWVEVRFAEPTALESVSVLAGVDGFTGAPVRRVEVHAGNQTSAADVDPATGLVEVSLDGRPVDRLRVTVTDVAGTKGVVALREISIPGVDVERQLVIPSSGTAETTFVLRARPPRRGCIDAGLGVGCGYVADARVGEEESGMVREISVTNEGLWDVEGAVVARSTSATQRLLEPILESTRVRGSSTYREAPNLGAQLAFDGDSVSFWAASPADPRPTLRLRWPHRRLLTSLGVVAPIGTAVAPTRAELTGEAGQTRMVDLTRGLATFAPMRTRRLVIRFDPPTAADAAPVGVAELDIPNLEDQVHRTDRNRTTGAVCGLGPEIEVDGRVYPTAVTGSIGAVLDGTPLTVTGCGGPVPLTTGTHEVRVIATDQYTATRLTLRPPDATDVGSVTQRDVSGGSWTTSRRVLDVAPGPAALLVLTENVNAGWRAMLDGHELTPLRVDGWMQGYLLPAGDGGRVTLEFTPNRHYQAGLGLGALLALVLVTAAVLVGRREERSPPLTAPDPQHTVGVRPWAWRWRLPALAAGVALGGPAFAAGLLVGDLGRRRIGDPGTVGAVLVGTAALASGLLASQQASRSGLPPTWCDALAAAGVGVAAAVLLTRANNGPAPD
jgi:arabinofuranan 3-O-arabinosyltransferase